MYKLYVSAVDEFYVLHFKKLVDAQKEMLIAQQYYTNKGFVFVCDDEAIGGMSVYGTKKTRGRVFKVSMRIEKETESNNIPWRSKS